MDWNASDPHATPESRVGAWGDALVVRYHTFDSNLS